MTNGYYLSAYLHIGELACIGRSQQRHDQNLALWKYSNGKVFLIHYWEVERISGFKKHSLSFFNREDAVLFINDLLSMYRLTLDDMVEIWGTPILDTADNYHSLEDYKTIAYHSIAHLYSGLLLDTEIFYNETIIGLAVDGGPDYVVDIQSDKFWYAGCVVRKGQVSVFPIESPGPLYSQAASRFGLEEGSLMALASATTSAVVLDRHQLICDVVLKKRGAYPAAAKVLNSILEQVAEITQLGQSERFTGWDPHFSEEENTISIVMKEIQAVSIMIMEKSLSEIVSRYGIDSRSSYLSLSGGFALNCPCNTHLVKKFGFRDLLSFPGVNDGGESFGIALYAFHKRAKETPISFKYTTPFTGNGDDTLDHEIQNFAEFIEDVSAIEPQSLVSDLKAGPIVWFNGRAEMGPRALGNRSILGDPSTIETKKILNILKDRQWWRPVAPVIMEDKLNEWLDEAYPSPYMLQTFLIKAGLLARIPAIAHHDRSARIQSVSYEQNSLLYEVLTYFYDATNIPMLCNTSLNDKGEPIVDTIAQAFNFCLRKGISVAYINGSRIQVSKFDQYQTKRPLSRKTVLFDHSAKEDWCEVLSQHNPFELSNYCIQMYLHNPNLQRRYDPKIFEDASALSRLANLLEDYYSGVRMANSSGVKSIGPIYPPAVLVVPLELEGF